MTATYSTWLVAQECYKCGIAFGLPADFRENRLQDHRFFHCPNGHSQHYLGKTDAEKLKDAQRELARTRTREQATRDQLHASERSRAALRGVNTRTKRRIANGICPCCSRSFKDLAAHMEGQHPDYVAEANDG